ncbi:MAG: WYL domain-containing protein [Actinomycetota bacterium]
MAGEDRTEPLERLLNLVALLLETRAPLTFEQIRETLEPYRQEKVDSAKRMFERDKDLLRDYGVPLELVDVDAWGGDQGYVIPKDAYYLPEIAFTPEELGALLVAAQSGDENTAAERAVHKLLYGADGGVLAGLTGGPLASGSDARSELVLAVAAAAQGHGRISFGYRTSQGKASEREVDAFAMVFRGGHWYLVGHDRDRDDVRAFRLSRFTSEPEDRGVGTSPPPGFSAADHVRAGPWDALAEERAVIAFSPDVAWWAASSLTGATTIGAGEDGWVEVAVPLADEQALAGLVLQFGDEAVAREPASLRDAILERLAAIRA